MHLPHILLTILPLASASPLLVQTSSSRTRSAADGNATGCTASSLGDFAWSLKGFRFEASFTFTTPAHQNSWGYLDFNVTNPATGVEAICSARSNQLSDFFYATFPYTCKTPNGAGVYDYDPNTRFDFERAIGQLRFNQTWTCRDQDPEYPARFTAYGMADLSLDCNETMYRNPNWTMGQIYSSRQIKCLPVTLDISPYEMEAVA